MNAWQKFADTVYIYVLYMYMYIYYWKCNFPMSRPIMFVCWMVCWSVGWTDRNDRSVILNTRAGSYTSMLLLEHLFKKEAAIEHRAACFEHLYSVKLFSLHFRRMTRAFDLSWSKSREIFIELCISYLCSCISVGLFCWRRRYN